MAIRNKFTDLFTPGKIGTLQLKNRIVMPAMGTSLCAESGEVTEALIEYYRRRADGQCGLITVEVTAAATAVDPLKMLSPGLRADDERYIPGLARLAEAIHRSGAKAGIQLSAGGGAQAMAGPWLPGNNAPAVSPSGVPALVRGFCSQPRALNIAEIEEIAVLMGRSALNVKQAGFDMVEIHAHGGYLISEFLTPYFNRRTDKYGGSLDNRCRLLLDIVATVKKQAGPGFTLTVKYSVKDYLPDGWDVDQSQGLARKLEAAGADGIGVSCGVHGVSVPSVPPYFYPRGMFLPLAEAIKEVVNIPVVVGGRLDDPEVADKAIREGKTDFIYLGRGLIADPDWPQKVMAGRAKEVRPCLACCECLGKETKGALRCSSNPVAGRELESGIVRPAAAAKKVLIAGGGPAGMQAALIAALRGHKVTLCEKQSQLGGLMLLAAVHNQEVTALLRWMGAQVKKSPVEVRLQTEVTPSLVDEIRPDVLIFAGGGTFISPKIAGIERNNVFSARNLLDAMNGSPAGKGVLPDALAPMARGLVTPALVRRLLGSNFPIKKNVAVIGGQFPGCSLALFLAMKGKKVTIIEESASFGKDLAPQVLDRLRFEVEQGNVKIVTSTRVEEITERELIGVDSKGTRVTYETESVIIALELAPSDSSLASEFKGRVKEIYTIGDAGSFRRMAKSLSDGYLTALSI